MKLLIVPLLIFLSSSAFAQSNGPTGFKFKYLTPVYSTVAPAPFVSAPTSSSRWTTTLGVGAASVPGEERAMGLSGSMLKEFGGSAFSFATGAMYLREGVSDQAGVPVLAKISSARRSTRWGFAAGGMPSYAFSKKAIAGVALAALTWEFAGGSGADAGSDKRVGIAYDRSIYAQSALLTFGMSFRL